MRVSWKRAAGRVSGLTVVRRVDRCNSHIRCHRRGDERVTVKEVGRFVRGDHAQRRVQRRRAVQRDLRRTVDETGKTAGRIAAIGGVRRARSTGER
ncbi:MAG: hypothetical protein U5K38_10320 [Woeseiaceae bacterium]|nr:hypothetical protein [Woeseiaceae bacterium]